MQIFLRAFEKKIPHKTTHYPKWLIYIRSQECQFKTNGDLAQSSCTNTLINLFLQASNLLRDGSIGENAINFVVSRMQILTTPQVKKYFVGIVFDIDIVQKRKCIPNSTAVFTRIVNQPETTEAIKNAINWNALILKIMRKGNLYG